MIEARAASRLHSSLEIEYSKLQEARSASRLLLSLVTKFSEALVHQFGSSSHALLLLYLEEANLLCKGHFDSESRNKTCLLLF